MSMPLEIIGLGKREVRFIWEEGVEDVWGARELRIKCACANCQSEATGERILDPKTRTEVVALLGRLLLQAARGSEGEVRDDAP